MKKSGNQNSPSGNGDKTKQVQKGTGFKCAICSKQCKTKVTWRQHMKSHLAKIKCDLSEKSFTRNENLYIHKKKAHGVEKTKRTRPSNFTCQSCGKHFGRKDNLNRHELRIHRQLNATKHKRLFSCRHCDREFQNYNDLFNHVTTTHPLSQLGGRRTVPSRTLFDDAEVDKMSASHEQKIDDNKTNDTPGESTEESALGNGVVNTYLYPTNNERYDVLVFFGNVRDKIRSHLLTRIRARGGIKWNVCVQVEMQRDDSGVISNASPYFRSLTYVALTEDFEEHNLNEAMQKMYASLEKYMREGWGWYVKSVVKLEIHSVIYTPLGGSAYIPLPKSLACSRSIVNIQCEDGNKCFLFCLLAAMHPVQRDHERIEHYLPYENEVNMRHISYPVTLPQIRKVETQNANISINVFAFEDDTIIPLRITEKRGSLHHVNLLLIKMGEKSHYCLITELNRFLSRTNKHQSQLHFCPYCLHGFRREDLLHEHIVYCSSNGAQRVDLPISGKNDILEFKDYEKTLKVPFVIYADFETVNRKIDTCAPNPNKSSSTQIGKHEVCGFGYKVVCEKSIYTKPSVIYRGKNASAKLLEHLLEEQKEIEQILSYVEPMQSNEEQKDAISNATQCCICEKKFTIYDQSYGRIVRHHNHLTGEFVGPACNGCNLNCKQATFIPVIFHNLKNFDSHILCQNLGQFKSHKMTCIAQSTEKYVSFSLGKLRFIDSFQFLPTSLETLVNDLAEDGLNAFPYLLSETKCKEEAKLLLRKGVLCYEYLDSFERFEETKLPPKKEFYSSLKKEHISDEDYDQAQTVYERFQMTSLGEYHDLYLKTDVVLLSDVFESFRNFCMQQYQLDPCHFYTSPGFSWSACLKMTGVRLELLSDIDQVLMVERGILGGISQISNRYFRANNPYLESHDSSKPTSFLQNLDCVNLYGWAMTQFLPVADFKLMNLNEIESFNVMNIPENASMGYILEVSLHYPKSLHDSHNCLPLAPIKRVVTDDDLSPYSKQLLKELFGLSREDALPKRGRVQKLLTTLEDKDHYVLHYRNLQLYLRLGMQLKAIHRILQFSQDAWMKKYINKNTQLRKEAKSQFQKFLLKLFNVSVFGKTMENVRQHKDIHLVHTEERLKKLSCKPNYKTTSIFNDDLVAVELYKSKVNLFKPIYCGMCILDLSKVLMYEFWYDYIKGTYGPTAVLHMTDTDSLLFSCECQDIYKDMEQKLDLFDTSEFPETHPLFSIKNKKELGKMKDETKGCPISEFVGLRSKMYSYMCDGKEEKRAKGIAKSTVSKDIKHESYKNVLFERSSVVSSMTCIRSHNHKLFNETIQKTGLSAFDDKRFLIDAVNSLAYGHYKIAQTNTETTHGNDVALPFIVNNYSLEELDDYLAIEENAFSIENVRFTPCVKNNKF